MHQGQVSWYAAWLGDHSGTVLETFVQIYGEGQFLASLPLKVEGKIQDLYIRAYPVLRHIAVLFFPTQQIIRKPNMAMRIALGICRWALPTKHWRLLQERGGVSLGSTGDVLLWCHSTVYVTALRSPEPTPYTTKVFRGSGSQRRIGR